MTRLFAFVLAAALCLSLQVAVPEVTSAATAPACGRDTPLDGIVGSATPVVLVHGWTGEPMKDTRTKLEKDGAEGRQYLLFDYSAAATAWADDSRISECLATYVKQVSERHRARGGDGMVYLVAHSMGGLAIRFALDPRYGRISGLSRLVGGVVTLDTPFRGSMWGDSGVASLISLAKKGTGFPREDARAWHCLSGGPAKRLPSDCAAAPTLDPEVPLAQVAGEVTVRRTLFGMTAYEMNLMSDGIVDTDSQHGSRDSSGAVGPNQAAKPVVPCQVDTGDLGVDVFHAWGSMLSDSLLLDIYGGKLPADVSTAAALSTLLKLLFLGSCSHINITESAAALDEVDDQLAAMIARGRELTSPAQLRKLKVPADCDHPAGVIPGTHKEYGPAPEGYDQGFVSVLVDDAIFGDLTGDGRSDAVVPMLCSAGGVSWPERLLVYGPGVRLLGSVRVGDADAPQEHADVQAMRFDGDEVSLDFTSYEGAGFNVAGYRGTLGWHDGHLSFEDGGPLTVTYDGDTAGLGIGSGVVTESDAADTWVRPAPQDFRDFLQSTWNELGDDPGCPPTVVVERWSHLGFASGYVSGCGGYATIWAEDGGTWSELMGYQEGPYCDALSAREREAVTALGIECLDSSGTSATLLGAAWPESGE